MKLKKIKNMKQKIITIPIIIVTLISFIIPNYAQAGWLTDVGDDLCQAFIDLILYIPDGILVALQNFFIEDTKYSDIIKKTTLSDFWEDVQDETTDGTFGGFIAYIGTGALGKISKIPVIGLIAGIGVDEGVDTSTEVAVSNIKISPLSLFSNKIKVLDVNIFKDPEEVNSGEKIPIASTLHNLVAVWYYSLRNIALVLMLLVLVYIGIKITVSSVSSDKAKYKQLLVDWLVGICLLITMHYIMVFMVNIVDSFSSMFNTSSAGQDPLLNVAATAARTPIDSEDGSNTLIDDLYWTLIYTSLVFLLVVFLIQYVQRIIKMVFLTLIAPVMALTYPLDKMADGKAQGFDRWLKDYIFTLLIQPMHLILYMVLISAVSDLAVSNPIYTICALFSFFPTEKLLREFLGFDRGHIKGPNPIETLATASLLGDAAKQLMPGGKGKKGTSNTRGGDSNETPEKPIDTRMGDRAIDLLADGEENEEQNEETGNNAYERAYSEDEYNDILDEVDSQNGIDEGRERNNYGYSEDEWNDIMNDVYEQNGYTEDDLPLEQEEDEEDVTRDRHGMTGNRFSAVKNKVGAFGRGLNATGRILAPGVKSGLRKGAKIAAATTLGSAGLVIGAATGIATESLSHAVRHAATGAAGGIALGNKGVDGTIALSGGIKNGVKDTIKGLQNTSDAFRGEFNPEKFEKTLSKRNAKDAYNSIIDNSNAMRSLRIKANKYDMSDKQLKEAIKSYSNQGIVDYKDIGKGIELENDAGVSQKQAMGAIKLSKDFDISTLRKDEAKVKQEIQNNLQGKDSNPEQKAQKSIDLMKMVYGMTPTRRL